MPVNLKGRSFLTLKDFTPDEIRYMLNLAADLKAKKRAGIRGNLLAGKNIVLLFEKTSTRTRCAFEVAAYDEGAHVTFLDSKSSQMGKKETMVDTAKVLGRFFDGIEYRGYDQKVVEGLAANAGVPVWNGLTDVDHPTQALADILTLMENTKKPLNKCKLVFCGDTRNNVAYCLMDICAKLGQRGGGAAADAAGGAGHEAFFALKGETIFDRAKMRNINGRSHNVLRSLKRQTSSLKRKTSLIYLPLSALSNASWHCSGGKTPSMMSSESIELSMATVAGKESAEVYIP